MERRFKALDWILAAVVAAAYTAGLTIVATIGQSDDTVAMLAMSFMWLLGFLFLVFAGMRIAIPRYGFFLGCVLSAASFLCPLILLEGFNPLLLLVVLAVVVVPSGLSGAAFSWAEKSGRGPRRLAMRITAALVLLAGVAAGGVFLGPMVCERYDLGSYAIESPNGLEFRLVAETGKDSLTREYIQTFVESGQSPPGWMWVAVADDNMALPNDVVTRSHNGQTQVLLANAQPYILTASREPKWGIRSAKISEEGREEGKAFWVFLSIRFNKQGGEYVRELSQTCLDRHLAIVIGGELHSAPLVRDRLGDRAQIHVGIARGSGQALAMARSELREKARSLRELFQD